MTLTKDSTIEPTVTIRTEQTPRRKAWHRAVQVQQEYPVLQVIAIIIILAVGSATLPGLLNVGGITLMLVLASLVGIAALGHTLVMIIGGIDLSAASLIPAAGLAVVALPARLGIDFWIVAVLTLVGTGLIGAGVGYICHRFDLNPLIVSLGSGAFGLGIVYVLAAGNLTGSVPSWLSQQLSPVTKTFGFIPLPPIVIFWFAVIIVVTVFLRWTAAGKRTYAVGANRRAANLALVPTRRIWVTTFLISGLCWGLVGILLAGFAGSVSLDQGAHYMFQGLAAVVVGGTVVGARGDYIKSTAGVLLITVLNTVLAGHGFTKGDQQILFGLVILVSVMLYGRERRVRDRV
ncbi:ABC transporter permease [Microbacterium sp. A196]|uniref:ABC transporter permease n=1 Tax=unclassified Microbacterium TaxID=2609290 RepID=UPI003FD02786